MKSSVKQLLREILAHATRRPEVARTRAMGRSRIFHAYDRGNDTFVFEKGVWGHLDAHASVLMAAKRDLRHNGGAGYVMTFTTGNHSVAALPLLQGKFWDLCHLPQTKMSEVMSQAILCGNVVAGKLEISQRDVPCTRLASVDAWLTGPLAFALPDVIMVDRNDAALEYFRTRGQEWRVKPLAWTAAEMSTALAASRKRISSSIRYYHGSRGVHFLSFTAFHALGALIATDFPKFREGLHELVSVFEGHQTSFLRQPKYHGHHEIELFGLSRGVAYEEIVPKLEMLMEKIELNRISPDEVVAKFDEVETLYRKQLSRPEFADDQSKVFIETLYMYVTGEIYSVNGEGSTPAFDDRRTALPGATYVRGRPDYHPLCDTRSEVLLSNIRSFASREESIEYANVYELRTEDSTAEIGKGSTREIVFKTDRSPLVCSLIEKRLARPRFGYGNYVLARAQAFKALGVELPSYRLLHYGRLRGKKRLRYDYFLRSRSEGEPLADIPPRAFQLAGEFGGADAGEDPQVVRALATLMGDAAAQNLVMKKYDPATQSPLFGVGKEIYRFDYDIASARLMPKAVSCCSVRGALGWPDLAYTDANLQQIASFYLSFYAKAVAAYAAAHPVCTRAELGACFIAGFEMRLKALEWAFTIRRDAFEDFKPELHAPRYAFEQKWRFALWALERHVRRLDGLRASFAELLEHPERPIESPHTATAVTDMDAIGAHNAQNMLAALGLEEI